ncbi:MAG: hydroxymethylglutaryl-CoA lyase [Saprospiraceae bacterium]|nr:hydroxymethylglutaryl-CoA lyase [Saprospiraceae bacterium]
MPKRIKLIECPRDAMQGLLYFIPTETKIQYLKTLMDVGFDTIDFGSFVSAKAIPQMADTHELTKAVSTYHSDTNLLAIIANLRGAEEAVQYKHIQYLGFPFSVSETFQIRNTNSTIEQSKDRVKSISELCFTNNKQLVVYLSMAFGNPYGDAWSAEVLSRYIEELRKYGISIFALSDTIGIASPESIYYLFESLIPLYPEIEIGAHLHTTPHTWKEKVAAASLAGCNRFDGAIRGFGGCPMAKDELTGNMPMENLISFFNTPEYETGINLNKFTQAMELSSTIFRSDH